MSARGEELLLDILAKRTGEKWAAEDERNALRQVVANVRALADQWSAEFRREFPNVGPQFADARADALRALLP